jgi:hypothetical protein
MVLNAAEIALGPIFYIWLGDKSSIWRDGDHRRRLHHH